MFRRRKAFNIDKLPFLPAAQGEGSFAAFL
jgi:hypothetical protein